MSDQDQITQALRRRLHHKDGQPVCFPSFQEAVKRLSEQKLRIYLGIDATSPHLHIGHTIPLLLLKDLSAFGHEIIVLLGDFTSRIGDPTDKMAARTAQTEEQVSENIKTYLDQIHQVLPENLFTVRRNSEWLRAMTFDKVADLASHVTVQQMQARDMFQERIKQEKPIFVSEFLYPLMQGYDSVAMEVDAEVGGNDQTFNMLVGRDLEKDYLEKDKLVLPTKLLVDAATGRKISKSEGGLIALDDDPATIFEKVSRSIPNDMIQTVFQLATDVPGEETEERYAAAQESGDWRAYNLDLATTIVKMYYDEETAQKEREEYERVAHGETPEDIKEVRVDGDSSTTMTHILAEALEISRSEAKRLIDQKAVTRNGQPVVDALGPGGIEDEDVLRVGSHRPFRVKLGK